MRSLPSADHHTDFGDAVGWLADMHRPHVFGDHCTSSIEPSLSPGGIPSLKLSVDRRFGPAQQLGDWSTGRALDAFEAFPLPSYLSMGRYDHESWLVLADIRRP